MKGIFSKWFVVLAALLATACADLAGGGDAPFVPVTAISGVPETVTAGQDIALTGAAAKPANATNSAIAWQLREAGATGAVIIGGILRTVDEGTLVVTATVANGLGASSDYTQDFTIAVKSGLAALIGAANAAKSGVAVSAEGGDVPADAYWTPQAAFDALNGAIASAETAAQNPAATRAETEEAIAALTEALGVFTAAKQRGTRAVEDTPIAAPDKEALDGAITAANAVKSGVAASADGGDVPAGLYWAPQAAFDALNGAIASAETVSRNPAADQAGTDAAASALTEAITAFNAAKKPGTKAPPETDTGTLAGAITAANAVKSGVVASADGSDAPVDVYWATRAAFDALDGAIDPAETLSHAPAASRDETDSAKAALTAATNVFAAAKQPGTNARIKGANKRALAAAVNAANAAKSGVLVSADGGDVPADAYWACQTLFDTLNAAIASAETVSQDPASAQAAVNSETTALNTATGVFSAAKKKGNKSLDIKTVSLPGGLSFNLRYVKAPGPGGFKWDSAINRIATISNGYWTGETEITQELFEAVMGTNPAYFARHSVPAGSGENRARRPVENVNWYAAIAFCNKLSLLDGKTPAYSVKINGVEVDWSSPNIPRQFNSNWEAATVANRTGYRLPYEVEWLWAAMGGNEGGSTVTSNGYTKSFAGSDGTNSIGDYAWHAGNAGDKTREVGKKLPNELGLYDMSGNVAEWCWEQEGQTSMARHAAKPEAPDPARKFRGGSWYSSSDACAVGYRGEEGHDYSYKRMNYVGIRVVLDQ
jgi:formylglycine-generating enzyme required for sulfatase activity